MNSVTKKNGYVLTNCIEAGKGFAGAKAYRPKCPECGYESNNTVCPMGTNAFQTKIFCRSCGTVYEVTVAASPLEEKKELPELTNKPSTATKKASTGQKKNKQQIQDTLLDFDDMPFTKQELLEKGTVCGIWLMLGQITALCKSTKYFTPDDIGIINEGLTTHEFIISTLLGRDPMLYEMALRNSKIAASFVAFVLADEGKKAISVFETAKEMKLPANFDKAFTLISLYFNIPYSPAASMSFERKKEIMQDCRGFVNSVHSILAKEGIQYKLPEYCQSGAVSEASSERKADEAADTNTVVPKNKRQKMLLKLISMENIDSQAELARKLQANGFQVTQATVSRDIKELKITKTVDANGSVKYATQAVTPATEATPTKTKISTKQALSPETISPYLRRAFMFMEDGDFERADEYLETVLDLEPENAEAYLGKLMVELRVGTREMLQDQQESFDNNPNYQKAMRFGDESLKTELSGYTDYVIHSKRAPSPENIRPYLRRAFMFMEDGDFERADEYLETVLDLEPENAEAYLGKLMVELRVGTREMLQNQQESFDNNPNYQKAMRFGDESLKTELSGYTDYIIHRNDTSRKEAVFQKAVSASLEGTIGGYRIAKQLFASIPGYRNADEQKKRCQELAKEAERKETYERCSKILSGGVNESFDSWTKAINGFEKLGNYRDAPKLAEKCMKRRTQYLLDRLEKANTSDEFNTLLGQIMRLRSNDVPDMDELISRCDKEKTYYTVIESKKGKLHLSSQRRIQLLQKIPGWRDADALLKEELAAAERDRKRKEREKRITEQRAAYKAKYPLKDQRDSLQKEKERLRVEKKKVSVISSGGVGMIIFGSIPTFLGLLTVITCLGDVPGIAYPLLIVGGIMILIGLCMHPEGAIDERRELSRKIREINKKIREIDSYPAFDENADYMQKQ